MGLESLQLIELLQVTFSFIFVVISFIICIRIFLKYYEYRSRNFLLVGVVWLFLSSPWWGNAISFFTWMFYEQEIDIFLDLFLGNIFVPIALLAWVYIFTNFVYKHLKRKVMVIYGIICGVYEFFLILFFFIDYRIIGYSTAPFNTEHNVYPFVFQIFAILTALITGILFARESMKSPDPKTKWKGRFLMLAFISFTIAAVFDAAIPMNALTLVIVRSILILSAVEYYLGFFIPDKLVNVLVKERSLEK
ncbi:MAG: conserved membrane protein of unknown function [Promethearchaeota archaeon]|nr:MAG: conserved membrane protein of unknown function [Candidatus Lokiarchaeota archaeon]